MRWFWLVGAGLFTVFSFLTKQDGGGLAFLVAFGVLGVYGWLYGRWKPLLIYVASFAAVVVARDPAFSFAWFRVLVQSWAGAAFFAGFRLSILRRSFSAVRSG